MGGKTKNSIFNRDSQSLGTECLQSKSTHDKQDPCLNAINRQVNRRPVTTYKLLLENKQFGTIVKSS